MLHHAWLRCLAGRSLRRCSSSPEMLAKRLADDPESLRALVKALPVASKKVVFGMAMTELEDEFVKADRNLDGNLSYAEFSEWAAKIAADGKPRASTTPATPEQLRALALTTMVPYIGFGMCDNAVMCLTGDVIDQTIGAYLGLSMLAAAAIGNALANGAGMVLHGTIERFASRIGLPNPRLTSGQRATREVKNAKFTASVSGVMIGCMLGMFPLLFRKSSSETDSE